MVGFTMKFYLFPKNFQNLCMEDMLDAAARCGFDGPTALIRDGYWISRSNIKQDLPAFVKAAEQRGLEVQYGSADLNLDRLPEDEEQLDILKCFASCGITKVRMQHVAKRETDNVRLYAERFRRQAQAAADAGEKAGLQCIIQLHGYCYPHNATAAYAGIQGLDPRYIGIKLDPGNNICQEGYELYWYQIGLLGEYLAAVGAKDVTMQRAGDVTAADKGWQVGWVPANEGMINYQDVFARLRAVDFDGPVIQMPFYNAASTEEMIKLVQRELSYFKACAKEE